MNKHELLIQIHEYNQIEKHLMAHPELRVNKKLFHEYTNSLSEEIFSKFLFSLVEEVEEGKVDAFPETYFFKKDNSMKIEISQHTRYSPPVTHKHDFYELFFVYEGEFQQIIENESFIMRTGDICMIPPGVYHSLDVNNYSVVINILIQKDTFRELFMSDLKGDHLLTHFFLGNVYSKNVNNYIIFRTNGDLAVTNMIIDMYLEVINKEKYFEQVLYSSLLLFFSHLLRYYEQSAILPEQKNKSDILDFRILKYINENFKQVSLDELSKEFNYSKQYLSLRIKKLTNLSFNKYLLKIRMEVAENLLLNTKMKIIDISDSVGFQNHEHFIRSFKKYFETTPSNFRKR
ncbi:helix-turn-helix transcriptional regulator [Enterococcus casseliflavus]|uniref:helix-turn-helix domain-containing protein n=1 Tax=Enterococcus casseliflavus TaxID=37734 RepID=UPI00115C228E|nr:AraC family transcriptional regulator [Enterococcus casseliflavus]NKD28196.1 helix-turn-helix transcriptional regulator [Enterococcus casseliflavus]